MRPKCIKFRERIGLIKKQTKTVVGVADIVDMIGPLNEPQELANIHHHRVPADEIELLRLTPRRQTTVGNCGVSVVPVLPGELGKLFRLAVVECLLALSALAERRWRAPDVDDPFGVLAMRRYARERLAAGAGASI